MTQRSKKGSALVFVLLLMALLMILGASLLSVSSSESVQISYENKRIKAYYLALGGAKTALEAWKSAQYNSTAIPTGDCDTVYLQPSGAFDSAKPSTDLGNFKVNVNDGGSGTAVIKSTGNYSGTSQNVVATITYIKNNYVMGHDSKLNWYDYNSGQVNSGSYTYNGAVVIAPKNYLKLPNSDAAYQATQLFFECDIDKAYHGNLYLVSSAIVFDESISLDKKNSGDIIMSTLNGTNGTVYIKNPNDLSKYYSFSYTSNVSLSDILNQISANPDANLVSSSIVPQYKNFSITNISWSK